MNWKHLYPVCSEERTPVPVDNILSESVLKRLEDARTEATRFIERCKRAETEIKNGTESYSYSPSCAAAKRSSMDLTRALARLRKST